MSILAEDCSWSWWTKPRATYVGGRTWLGTIASGGEMCADVAASDGTSVRFILRRQEADDHNNPAIIAVAGKVPVAIYTQHAAVGHLYVRKGSANAENGLRAFGSTAEINVPSGTATYAICQHYGDEIHVWSRHAAKNWCHIKSDDWGATWDAAVSVFSAPTGTLYAAMGHIGGADQTVRVALKEHPEQAGTDLYVCDVGLVSGDITLPGSATVLGNIHTGANLPLTYTTLQQVKNIGATTRSWVFDVSTDGAIAWVEFDDADIAGTSTYYYAEFAGGVWVPRQVVGAGTKFGQNSDGAYIGGIQLAGGGVAITAREDDGTWLIERHTTVNGGSTWTTEVLAESDDDILVRAWPVGGTADDVVYNRLTRFGINQAEYEFDYLVFDGTIETAA